MEWDKKIPLGRRGKLRCSSKFNGAGRHTLTDTDRNVGMLEVQEVIMPESLQAVKPGSL